MRTRLIDPRTALFFGAGLLLGKTILGPLALIWALNTLFPLSIPFTFKSWLAALALLVVLRLFTGKTAPSSDREEDEDDYDYDYEFEDADDYTDEHADDDDDFEDEFYEDAEARRRRLKENLIVYRPTAKKENSPPEKKS